GVPGVLLAVSRWFRAVSGIALVAVAVVLAESAPPATRGLVMGGYSTALYLGLAVGSFALGPVMTHGGYGAGFALGGAAGAGGTACAGVLWLLAPRARGRGGGPGPPPPTPPAAGSPCSPRRRPPPPPPSLPPHRRRPRSAATR